DWSSDVCSSDLTPLRLWRDGPVAARDNPPLQWFFLVSAGLFINIAGLFLLGMVGWLNEAGVAVVGIALLALALLYARSQGAFSDLDRPSGVAPAEAVVLTGFLFIAVVSAFHAPGHWDDTMYQLPLARDTLRHESIVVNEYLRFPLFPQTINLLIALGLMLGGDVVAQAFATLPLFVMVLGLIGASRWLTASTVPGVLASILLFVMAPVKRNIGYAYVDDGLALFCWGAALALALWAAQDRERRTWGWLVLAGVLAGAGAGSKYFGGVFAALGGVSILLMRRDIKAFVI